MFKLPTTINRNTYSANQHHRREQVLNYDTPFLRPQECSPFNRVPRSIIFFEFPVNKRKESDQQILIVHFHLLPEIASIVDILIGDGSFEVKWFVGWNGRHFVRNQ